MKELWARIEAALARIAPESLFFLRWHPAPASATERRGIALPDSRAPLDFARPRG